jgi:hypothetical protein
LRPLKKWWKTWTTRWSTGENELLSLHMYFHFRIMFKVRNWLC